MNGLEALAPQDQLVTVAGREIALSPVRMGQLSAFSKAAMPVAGLVLAGRYLEAITEQYEAVRAAVAIGANVDADWLDGLTPDEFIRLAAQVVEVNADFFARRLTPIILVMQAKMQAAMEAIGPSSLPTLGETDTGLRPS